MERRSRGPGARGRAGLSLRAVREHRARPDGATCRRPPVRRVDTLPRRNLRQLVRARAGGDPMAPSERLGAAHPGATARRADARRVCRPPRLPRPASRVWPTDRRRRRAAEPRIPGLGVVPMQRPVRTLGCCRPGRGGLASIRSQRFTLLGVADPIAPRLVWR